MSTVEPARTDVSDDAWDPVRDLPPSAKLVAKVLAYEGSLTQQQVSVASMLPPRTVRDALGRLEEVDAVDARFSFTDARKRVYSLTLE